MKLLKLIKTPEADFEEKNRGTCPIAHKAALQDSKKNKLHAEEVEEQLLKAFEKVDDDREPKKVKSTPELKKMHLAESFFTEWVVKGDKVTLNEDIKNLVGNYTVAIFDNTAAAERREQTPDDIEDDYHEESFHSTGDLEALGYVVDEFSNGQFFSEDYDDIDDLISDIQNADLGAGSPIIMWVKRPDGTFILDTGLTQDTFKEELNESVKQSKDKCCICGCDIEGYGNNAAPVKDGRCCDKCNLEVVIPARIANIKKNESKLEEAKDTFDDEDLGEDDFYDMYAFIYSLFTKSEELFKRIPKAAKNKSFNRVAYGTLKDDSEDDTRYPISVDDDVIVVRFSDENILNEYINWCKHFKLVYSFKDTKKEGAWDRYKLKVEIPMTPFDLPETVGDYFRDHGLVLEDELQLNFLKELAKTEQLFADPDDNEAYLNKISRIKEVEEEQPQIEIPDLAQQEVAVTESLLEFKSANAKDLPKILHLCKVIGLKTASDLDKFQKEELIPQDADLLQSLYAYCVNELGLEDPYSAEPMKKTSITGSDIEEVAVTEELDDTDEPIEDLDNLNEEKLDEMRIFTDGLENFVPYGEEATATFNAIKDANKLKTLEFMVLEEMYPNGIGYHELNDLLKDNSDWIFKMLNMTSDEEPKVQPIIMHDTYQLNTAEF